MGLLAKCRVRSLFSRGPPTCISSRNTKLSSLSLTKTRRSLARSTISHWSPLNKERVMEEGVPSVSVSGVASRFVSQSDVEAARARREEQWKAAYARLGQEPPPQPTDDSFDGRSLAEKLAANRAAKQEEWEEKMKLGNQFRALEEDEIVFLDSIREKQAEEERLRKVQDGAELSDFRKAVAARENAMNKPPSVTPPSSKPTDNLTGKDKDKFATGPPKRDTRKVLKGVVVKKKSKLPTLPQQDSIVTREDQPEKKRRKIS